MKEKFLTPKVDANATRKKFTKKAEQWNMQFYDEEGKFVRQGSKIISTQQKEIFMALVAIMNARLKVYNHTVVKKNNEYRNFVKNPFIVRVSTLDIQNMLMPGVENKTEKGRIAIRRALCRFEDAGIIIHKKFRREFSKYDIKINPKITVFQELSAVFGKSCKLAYYDSKKTKCPYYTIYNYTLIKNKKSNHKDLQKGKNHQDDFNLLNKKSQKTKEQGEFVSDNRTLSEKKSNIRDFNKKLEKISGKKFNDEKKYEIIPKPTKTKTFSKDIKKINDDFIIFKENTIVQFYITIIYTLFSNERAKLYNPFFAKNSYLYTFVLQSLNELKTNALYFGNCVTVEDFTKQKIFLTDALIRMKKNWINTRVSFNTDYIAPNRFLNGSYKFNFMNAVIFHREKIKQKKIREKKSAKRKVSENQYTSLLNTIKNKIIKENLLTDYTVQKYFIVRLKSKYGEIDIVPKNQYDKSKIYTVLQSFLN